MEWVEIAGLAAKASAACEAALGQPQNDEHRKVLYMTLEPLAARSFLPHSEEISPHARGLINQSAFLADIVRGHIEDTWRTKPKRDDALQSVKRSSEHLLKVLNEIKKRAE
jgi:hypothetical protein